MSGFFSKTNVAILLSSTILFTGCSSDDGGTSINTAPATIDATNAEAIGKAAGEAIQIADATNGLPTSVVTSSTGLTEIDTLFINAANTAMDNVVNLPAAYAGDVSSITCSSGTASISMTDAYTGPVDITMTYNNCILMGTSITATGTFAMHWNDISDPNAGFNFTYTNFTVIDPDNGTTVTMNMTMDCPTGYLSCTFSSDFTGTDGTTHRVSNFSFSGDATFGFNGTATFSHGTYGSVSITATNITYGSCGTYPDGGTIAFSSTDGSSGTIIFNADCSVSGTWNDGISSGSF